MKTRNWPIWNVLLLLLAGVGILWWSSGCANVTQTQTAPVKGSPLAEPVASPLTPGEPYRFVAFGDWGAGTSFQRDVAAQLIALHARQPFHAVLMLGDNIYEDGNIKKYGQAYFTDMYKPLIDARVRFIVALGNHDIKGGYQDDQVEFFNMPGYYYQTSLTPDLDVFVINSNSFANDEVQQRWLNQSLGHSTARWKIVMGHHPVYSSGQHGNNSGLQRTLEPILARHKADFYLAGHDHNYERFQPIRGVQYIVSGAAGAYLRDFKTPVAHSQVRHKAHHFLSFELEGDTMRMRVIDKTGQVIDQAEWRKVPAQALPSAS